MWPKVYLQITCIESKQLMISEECHVLTFLAALLTNFNKSMCGAFGRACGTFKLETANNTEDSLLSVPTPIIVLTSTLLTS